ncbi:MAG: hypothetical protein KC502_23095 [Myxococcales bacterium]|nr:hypothetical protein [Myxococcales bacterium]
MHAFVRFRLPDGSTSTLSPGDFIGRLGNAALHLDDGRISEAHAMVSLRGQELKLLSLRGLFAVGGQPVKEAVLRPGLVIEPARGLRLEVVDVVLPELVLAIEGQGLPRQLLSGATSLFLTPKPRLLPRYKGEADAHIWNTGEGWRLRIGTDDAVSLSPGQVFELRGVPFLAVGVSLEQAARQETRLDGAVQLPLRIVASYDTVHVHRLGLSALALDGISARIVSELVAVGGPASWQVIAQEIWRHEDDRGQLRRKWDVNLARLRRKLRVAGVRDDLLRSGGTGQVELLLYDGDQVDDRT